MPGQNLLIRRCFQEAILLSSAMIKHTARSAAAGMRSASAAAANPLHAQEWLAAADSLEAQRRKLSGEYCKLLESHLRHAIYQLELADVPKLGRDALSGLAMNQSRVDPRAEPVSLRLQQQVMPLTEKRLSVLDSHISSAVGLNSVRADINPFRPEIMCNVLADLTLQHQMGQPRELDLWLTYLAPPYAGGLKRLYIDLVAIMRSRGVADAKFQLALRGGPSADSAPDEKTRPTPLVDAGDPEAQVQFAETGIGEETVVWMDRPSVSSKTAFPSMQQLARVFPGVTREAVQAFLYEPKWSALDAPLPQSYFKALEVTSMRFMEAAAEAAAPSRSGLAAFHADRRKQAPVDREPIALDLNQWLSSTDWGDWRSPVVRGEQVLLLKQQAKRISEVMGIDTVGTVLTQLAVDTSLLWPVREAFLALGSPLAHLAVREPWFLAKSQHPARALIETVAQKSYEYNDEYSESFQSFMRPLISRVQQLLAMDQAGTSADDWSLAFALALQHMQAAWEEGSPVRGAQQPLKAMQFAQARQALAHQLAQQWAEDTALREAPEPVAKFILEQWSLVLAHAKLTDARHQRDPGGYSVAAKDLLWSVSGAAAVGDPVRALGLLPTALSKLREGMGLIGVPPEAVKATLDMMLPYHSRLLEMRRRKQRSEARRQGLDVPDTGADSIASLVDVVDTPFDAQALLPEDTRTPWMNSAEMSEAGLGERDSGSDMLQEPSDATRMGALLAAPDSGSHGNDSVSGETADSLAQMAEKMLARMREGDWFDMNSHGEWQRVKLIWSNDNRSLFMFQSRSGSPHSMTRRICLKLIQSEQLLPAKRSNSSSRKLASLLESRH